MIIRPLELHSHLRATPRTLDGLFFVNAGLIALFFVLFGSRFIAAPGIAADLGAAGNSLPVVAGARDGAVPTTHSISMDRNGLLYDRRGVVFPEEIAGWLSAAAAGTREPSLLILADERVSSGAVSRLASQARNAGFLHVLWAANDLQDGPR